MEPEKDKSLSEHAEHLASVNKDDDPSSTVPVLLADEVSYGSGGVRDLLSSSYVFGAAFLASLGGFSFGYDQGVISVINVMPQFHKVFPRTTTAFGTSFMTGMLLLGCFIGCLFMPYLSDTISRKRAISLVVVLFNTGAIMQTAAKSYGVLVAGRTIGGIGVGTLAMGAPLYISEIAPPNLRGTLLVLESVSVVLGVVIAYWITYGTRDLAGEIAFRLPFGLQMVCATLLGICINFFPFSPRWLALVGRNEDCLRSLSKLRRLPADEPRVRAEFRGIIAEIEFQRLANEKRYPGMKGYRLQVAAYRDLLSRKNWRRVVVGVGVMFLQQFSGINAFIYYAPTLFKSIGQSDENSLILSGVFNVLQLVAVVVCFFVIDRVGRRPLAIVGGYGSCICYVIIAVLSGVYSKDWSANTAAGWACVAMAFAFILVYGVSYAPLGWALPPEAFPNALRSKGVGLSVCVNWLCNFIVGIATPPMLASISYGTYIFFACFCGLAGLWATFLLPETMGKTLEEMDDIFGDTSGVEERVLLDESVRIAYQVSQSVSV